MNGGEGENEQTEGRGGRRGTARVLYVYAYTGLLETPKSTQLCFSRGVDLAFNARCGIAVPLNVVCHVSCRRSLPRFHVRQSLRRCPSPARQRPGFRQLSRRRWSRTSLRPEGSAPVREPRRRGTVYSHTRTMHTYSKSHAFAQPAMAAPRTKLIIHIITYRVEPSRVESHVYRAPFIILESLFCLIHCSVENFLSIAHSAYPPACPRPTARCDDAPSYLDPASPWQHTHPLGKGGQGRTLQPMPTKATPMHPASTTSWYISLPGSAGGKGPELRRSKIRPRRLPKPRRWRVSCPKVAPVSSNQCALLDKPNHSLSNPLMR